MNSSNKKIHLSTNPRKNASLFSIFFYHWVNPLMRKGSKKELEQCDLYDVLDEDCSNYIGDKLEEAWNIELDRLGNRTEKSKNNANYDSIQPKLLHVIIRTFGIYLVVPGILCFVEECIVLVMQSWFMGQLMSYFNDEGASTLFAWVNVFGIVLMTAGGCELSLLT